MHRGHKLVYPEGLWVRLWSSFISVDFWRKRPTSEEDPDPTGKHRGVESREKD